MGRLLSGIPGWVVEGTAEYETESWRPHRADLSHKTHVLKNKMNEMDPHHDGFQKCCIGPIGLVIHLLQKHWPIAIT